MSQHDEHDDFADIAFDADFELMAQEQQDHQQQQHQQIMNNNNGTQYQDYTHFSSPTPDPFTALCFDIDEDPNLHQQVHTHHQAAQDQQQNQQNQQTQQQQQQPDHQQPDHQPPYNTHHTVLSYAQATQTSPFNVDFTHGGFESVEESLRSGDDEDWEDEDDEDWEDEDENDADGGHVDLKRCTPVHLVPATFEDICDRQLLYIRGQRAIVTCIDYPLIFWRYVDLDQEVQYVQEFLAQGQSINVTSDGLSLSTHFYQITLSANDMGRLVGASEYHRSFHASPHVFQIRLEDKRSALRHMGDQGPWPEYEQSQIPDYDWDFANVGQ